MTRSYHQWFSPNLQKNMELLVFGHTGTRVLFFPTRAARFYDYEDWGVIASIQDKIDAGYLQVFCVDSIDAESLYNEYISPRERIVRHIAYEHYIIQEVIPFMHQMNPFSDMISAGCSLGAYHAINIAMKYPHYFCKAVGMSGRYDLTWATGYFRDLFSGYHDEDIYFNTPIQFIPNLLDEQTLSDLRKMDIILAIGQEDAFLENNIHFSEILNHKDIHHHLYVWDEEAHKARYWRKMVQIYL
ncbi:alpha/beta hydrolase-fold protein [Flectobacillus sp. DC10W]|uniref:Alpha/beta hydrolase-fold protein n=1 Tax=Flectobacillus longus TaxID=2984207 RepID=A0ABT6YMQ7_9BACT|nr:alpha/beta hydrolase-fold protein [Flectobacillus longus]MDI9864889.1 alpha/beta hydrolase-fold protein [Flectobacillus longus]